MLWAPLHIFLTRLIVELHVNWNAELVIAGKARAFILTSNLIAFHLGKLLPDASPYFETRHLKAERAQGEQERAGRLLAAPREELIITPV